jgi:hypothetical protein
MSIATLCRRERTVLRPVVHANGVHRHSVRRLLDYKAERGNLIAGPTKAKVRKRRQRSNTSTAAAYPRTS